MLSDNKSIVITTRYLIIPYLNQELFEIYNQLCCFGCSGVLLEWVWICKSVGRGWVGRRMYVWCDSPVRCFGRGEEGRGGVYIRFLGGK